MNFNIGKLYEIKQYFWLLYPSKETAATLRESRASAPIRSTLAPGATAMAEHWSKYWSRQLNCIVSYIPEHALITLLKQDKEYIHVLSSNGQLGWMYVPNKDWVNRCFKEVK